MNYTGSQSLFTVFATYLVPRAVIRKIDLIVKEHILTALVGNNMIITYTLIEIDCARRRNLLEKEIKTGHTLVTNDFTGVNLKCFVWQIGTRITSLDKLHYNWMLYIVNCH